MGVDDPAGEPLTDVGVDEDVEGGVRAHVSPQYREALAVDGGHLGLALFVTEDEARSGGDALHHVPGWTRPDHVVPGLQCHGRRIHRLNHEKGELETPHRLGPGGSVEHHVVVAGRGCDHGVHLDSLRRDALPQIGNTNRIDLLVASHRVDGHDAKGRYQGHLAIIPFPAGVGHRNGPWDWLSPSDVALPGLAQSSASTRTSLSTSAWS